MLNPIDPIKIIVHKDRILEAINNVTIPAPITVGLDISNFCNNKCLWCIYKKYRKEHAYNMSKELIHKSIKDVSDANGLSICFSGGGDPTMNPHLNEAILYCKKYNLDSSLNTNGTRLHLLNDEVLHALSYIRVSLDAGTNKTHKKLHRPLEGNFNTILKNIEKITKKEVFLGIGYLVHKENCNEIFQVAKILSEIGCKYLQIRPLKNCSLTKKQKEIMLEQIEEAKQTFDLPIFESFSKMEETIGKKSISKCYMNRLVSAIGPDGYVYPCCELRGISPLGNVKNNSFKSIWFSDKHLKIIENMDYKKCPPCKYAKGNEYIYRIFIKDELHKNFI